jgi:HD-GYP domain-containing protein (c-di-GMP phosphodiesterase class II)
MLAPDTDITCVKKSALSAGRVWWLIVAGMIVTVSALTAGPFGGGTWERPQLMFSLVTVAAATCVIGATVVIALADQADMAEIGLLGSALMATSVLPLVHGLVTPDVLYPANEAFRTSIVVAMPVAVVVAAPLLSPRSAFGRWAARRWRDWTLIALLGVFLIGATVVFFPDAVATPAPHDPLTIALAVGMVLAIGSMSLRQLRLYELGGRLPNLFASFALAMLSVTALLPVVDRPYSPAYWWFHLSGVIGVLGACVGVGVTHRMSRSAQDILAPVIARDPLVAFELGLSPVVHSFVADLEMKDQITRDHVVRTCELALRVGERMGLRGGELRDLGLAGLLHDVGKLETPDDILKKPARLTPDEYEVIKGHTVDGEQMLASDPALASAALIVRSHHERVDGGGYPDGLRGEEIPLQSRIIAACDAIDAMTHDRPYRDALPLRLGIAVLREHSGSQWDPAVVSAVIASLPEVPQTSRLETVGRDADLVDARAEIPADIGELLAAVDAEI